MSGIAGISDLKVEMKHARMKFLCQATFDIRILVSGVLLTRYEESLEILMT